MTNWSPTSMHAHWQQHAAPVRSDCAGLMPPAEIAPLLATWAPTKASTREMAPPKTAQPGENRFAEIEVPSTACTQSP